MDRGTQKTNLLPDTLVTRCIRIIPIDSHGDVSLRMDFMVCFEGNESLSHFLCEKFSRNRRVLYVITKIFYTLVVSLIRLTLYVKNFKNNLGLILLSIHLFVDY